MHRDDGTDDGTEDDGRGRERKDDGTKVRQDEGYRSWAIDGATREEGWGCEREGYGVVDETRVMTRVMTRAAFFRASFRLQSGSST